MTISRSTPHVRPDPTGLLGLRAVEIALEAWGVDPNIASHGRLSSAIGRVVEGLGLLGCHVRIHALPLADVEVATGSLAHEPAVTAALHTYDLRSGDSSLGTLALDAPLSLDRAAVDEVARGFEMVLAGAWSAARAAQAASELGALDAATRGIAGVLDLDRVLQLITDRVRELARAQYAALGIVDQDGVIERFITSGIGRVERERIGPLPRGHGLLGVIVRESRPLRISDIATDPRRYGFPPAHPPMHSLLGLPITVKGRSIGRLYLTNKQPAGDFSEDDQRLVEMFALHAGIAIDNARLHEQVQRLAIVEERERIGRDLHDGIIQSIYAVGLSLEDVPELMEDEPEVARARVERAIDSLDQSIRDIRNFIFGLRPELLEQAGLVGGLAALADEFRVNSMVDVDLETEEVSQADLPLEQVSQLLSIAREALSNVARHSKATRGSVRVENHDGLVRLTVSDNGVGFDPDRPRGPSHQGMVNMRDRADAIGGHITIESEPEHGTRIIVEVSHGQQGTESPHRGDE
jgi:signal transduction histidine kinase